MDIIDIIILFLFISVGILGVAVSARQLYLVVKLRLFGTSGTATIIDFYEWYSRTSGYYRAHIPPHIVVAYPIVRLQTEDGRIVESRTLNDLQGCVLEKKWLINRNKYKGQNIEIFYIDKPFWGLRSRKYSTKITIPCIHSKWFKGFIKWLFIFILFGFILCMSVFSLVF
ncbi:MAG: hypothetical protein K6E98_06195 [Lachnospiraceae bacterium]|nr:hypothetical protein [Lachnospiraceae bacterium]